jgi:hypothetical protein
MKAALQQRIILKVHPIFKDEGSELAPYVTKVKLVQSDSFTIVLINNSNPKSDPETLGVFHKAVIVKPDLSKSRIVNSMVLNMLPKGQSMIMNLMAKNF